MYHDLRRVNVFEIILLLVGLAIGIIGFITINNLYSAQGALSWQMLISVFLWLVLIVLLILAATMEDVKEELAIVIKEHIEETKVLRNIEHDMLKEIKLLRDDLKARGK